jgi:CHAD domain-containing protein
MGRSLVKGSVSRRAQRSLARAAGDRRILVGAAATAGTALAAGVARELLSGDGADAGHGAGAYRIKRDESASRAIARIARDRLDGAVMQLREGIEDDAATAIHEARKDLKKTRSVLRLIRGPLGKDLYERESSHLRDASRGLSGSRDVAAKIEAVRALAERYADELPEGLVTIRQQLEHEHESLEHGAKDRESELRAAAAGAAEAITVARGSIDDWSFEKSGFKLLAPGLQRSYRRGRKRFGDVRRDPSPENVHEWRKRVKDLWYDLRLLRDTWPPVLREMADQAHELADLLGDHHDLTVLSEDVSGRSLPELEGEELTPSMGLIESRQEELLEAAVPIGERLYAESPKAFVTRLRAYWRVRRAP